MSFLFEQQKIEKFRNFFSQNSPSISINMRPDVCQGSAFLNSYIHSHTRYALALAVTIVAIKVTIQVGIKERKNRMESSCTRKTVFGKGDKPTPHGPGKIVKVVNSFPGSRGSIAPLDSSCRFLQRKHERYLLPYYLPQVSYRVEMNIQ